jgi:hypothetical protein
MDLANAGVKFDACPALHMVPPSPFTEGVFRRRSVGGAGMAAPAGGGLRNPVPGGAVTVRSR